MLRIKRKKESLSEVEKVVEAMDFALKFTAYSILFGFPILVTGIFVGLYFVFR